MTFFEKVVQAEQAVLRAKEIGIVSSETVLAFSNIRIDGDTASLTVDENYIYVSTLNQEIVPDFTSGIHIPYEAALVWDGEDWKITVIDFYDETVEPQRDPEMTVEEFVRRTTSQGRGGNDCHTACLPSRSLNCK